MPELIVVTRDGHEHQIKGEIGSSLMKIIRDGGIDEMAAICGGCCSCATCHIHIDPDFIGRLPPASADEADLLEFAPDYTAHSRLACQIILEPELDGMRVAIATES